MNSAEKVNLHDIAADYAAKAAKTERRVTICAGTGCVANGSLKVMDKLSAALRGREPRRRPGAQPPRRRPAGQHLHLQERLPGLLPDGAPLLRIEPDGILYTKVKAADVEEIVERTLVNHQLVDRLLYLSTPPPARPAKGDHEIPFYSRQKRVVLANCVIEPSSVEEYISKRGYSAAEKAYTAMTQKEICDCVLASGLRGRGGGGFPTGRKWQFTLQSPGPKKYVICNGDEGDPGAIHGPLGDGGQPPRRDRGHDGRRPRHRRRRGLRLRPRRVPPGGGAHARRRQGRRGQAPVGRQPLRFRAHLSTLHVMEGAGAFVCGEETALIASIEGKRGMPMPKPPFPAQSGLWGKPTVINNVETLASVP